MQWRAPNATNYTQCVMDHLPGVFFEPPTPAIIANATLHSDYIYHKASELLRLTSTSKMFHLFLTLLTILCKQWMALQRIASRHCDLRLVTFACEGWCGGTGDRNKGFVTTVMVIVIRTRIIVYAVKSHPSYVSLAGAFNTFTIRVALD